MAVTKLIPASNSPFNLPYISAGTMTGTAVITGPWLYVAGHATVSFQATWSGTPTGTFTASATLDADPDVTGGLGAVGVTISPTNPSGSASTTLVTMSAVGATWLRLVYTNSASTGTLNVSASGHLA